MNQTLRRLLAEDPVVVTGAGAICCAGTGVPALWQAVQEGRPGGKWQTATTHGRDWRFAVASVDHLPPHPLTGKVDRCVLLGLHAAQEAWERARVTGIPGEEIAVVAGTSRGPHQSWVAAEAALSNGKRLAPRLAASSTLASLGGAIAAVLHARGPGFTLSATCASGATAITAAAEMLALGRARIAVAGGADAPLDVRILACMESAGLLGHHADPGLATRPFSRDRNGFLPGEGAGFLVLERASGARARGAEVLGILSGWAAATEGEGRVGVATDGHALARVIGGALDLGGLGPEDVDYVNAHGTGTLLNDDAETAALRTVFPGSVPPVSATKAVTGHCLGASPALEAIICMEALRQGWLPVSANTSAPFCADLPFITGSGRDASLRHAVSGSLGFWGYHAALVFSRPD